MDLRKLLKLSSEGLIGFSTAPLNIIGILGVLISLFALFCSIYFYVKCVYE